MTHRAYMACNKTPNEEERPRASPNLYDQPQRPAQPPHLQLHTKHFMHPQCLPDAKIQHDLLATSGNGVGPDITVQALDFGALAAAAVTETAEDLTGFPCAELKGDGALSLQTGDGATEFHHGLVVAHLLALVDEVL